MYNINKSNKFNKSNKLIDVDVLKREPGATALLKEFKDHTDPSYIGPGTWNVIHRQAWRARTLETQQVFIDFMKDVCSQFPCIMCRGHCSEYINNHPLEAYVDVKVHMNGQKLGLGLFIWTWKFHNAVNTRLRKPMMSWDTAYSLYSDLQDSNNLVCSKTCLETENNNIKNEKNLRIHRIINKR